MQRNDPCPCESGKKYKKCCGKVRKIEETIIEATPEAELVKHMDDFEFEMPKHTGPSFLDQNTGDIIPIYIKDGVVENKEELVEWIASRPSVSKPE
jgi:hypothetical protein